MTHRRGGRRPTTFGGGGNLRYDDEVSTVNAALLEVINRRKRQSFLDWIADGGLPDLTDVGTKPVAYGTSD